MINIVIGILIGLAVGYGAGSTDAKSKYSRGFADGLAEASKKDRASVLRNNSCVLWWTMADGRTLVEARKAICGASR